MLKELLSSQNEALQSYLESGSGVGIVLLGPGLEILDCNLGFLKLLSIRKKPVLRPLADFLDVSPNDLSQSGELRLSPHTRLGVVSTIHCHVVLAGNGRLLFCERLILSESKALEQFGLINNELIHLQRESVKKNLVLEKLKTKLADRVAELEATLARVKQLEGIITVCMYCKKVKDDQNTWQKLEKYIADHSDARFSHGLCPHCGEEVSKKWSKQSDSK